MMFDVEEESVGVDKTLLHVVNVAVVVVAAVAAVVVVIDREVVAMISYHYCGMMNTGDSMWLGPLVPSVPLPDFDSVRPPWGR